MLAPSANVSPRRKDAIFELMDANSASNKPINSVVHLSKSEFFTREYPSITDALTDGLEKAQWSNIQKLVWENTRSNDKATYQRFIVDATPQDRLHAKTLKDRAIVHKANPAPGNKPICAGHEYSTLVYVPPGSSEERKRWVVPLSTERVPSGQKGHDFGMDQLGTTLQALGLEDELTVSLCDSAYATEYCRKKTSTIKNHIHISRLRNNRKLFELVSSETNSGGRPLIYGKKMRLNKPDTFLPHDEQITIPTTSKNGSQFYLEITGWNTVSFRGSRSFKANEHPFRLIRALVFDEHGNSAHKKPLWLAIFGEHRLKLSLHECVDNYHDRYDIEHYFRFGKQRLLMDSYQTCHTEHEEGWWKFCALCYCQLYLSNTLCQGIAEPWERYLPEFKQQDKQKIISAPFVQRGFAKLLRNIGSPAKKPVPRGNPLGRKSGGKVVKRESSPITFKRKLTDNSKKSVSSTFEKSSADPKPQNSGNILETLRLMLENINMPMEKFFQLAMSE